MRPAPPERKCSSRPDSADLPIMGLEPEKPSVDALQGTSLGDSQLQDVRRPVGRGGAREACDPLRGALPPGQLDLHTLFTSHALLQFYACERSFVPVVTRLRPPLTQQRPREAARGASPSNVKSRRVDLDFGRRRFAEPQWTPCSSL